MLSCGDYLGSATPQVLTVNCKWSARLSSREKNRIDGQHAMRITSKTMAKILSEVSSLTLGKRDFDVCCPVLPGNRCRLEHAFSSSPSFRRASVAQPEALLQSFRVPTGRSLPTEAQGDATAAVVVEQQPPGVAGFHRRGDEFFVL